MLKLDLLFGIAASQSDTGKFFDPIACGLCKLICELMMGIIPMTQTNNDMQLKEERTWAG